MVTGELGQQLETMGLSVRDISPKKGSFCEKTKKGGQRVRIRQIFGQFSRQSKRLDTFLTNISRKKNGSLNEMLSKRGSLGKRLLKNGGELLKEH